MARSKDKLLKDDDLARGHYPFVDQDAEAKVDPRYQVESAPGVETFAGQDVVVTWVDANSESGQLSKEEALALDMPIVRTYGECLEDSSIRIVIAGEVLSENKNGVPVYTYRDVTVIPRSIVRDVRTR